jgi:ABC-type polysaccharide/polyol phosphate transport system ATPase subunit
LRIYSEMDSDVVIHVDGLGKKYVIGHESKRERFMALRDVIGHSVRNFARTAADTLRGRPIFAGDTTEEFWALKDLSFEIKRGEVVGIIGHNGAGKSTLLKILSRITEPTEGRVTINGRVASLLEVGTGFHGELTGRENIYLNGAILGMRRAEIRRRFDEIVAFAEIDKFLDTPVKRYSSGMYVRLAFAVAAHLEPEILLVDEVLAVGDAEFQRRSLGKMSDVAKGGRTVLFVSHNLGAIRRLCSHAFLFESGKLAFGGDVDQALTAYERLYKSSDRLAASAKCHGPLADQVRFDQIIFRQGGAIVSVLNALRKFEVELRGFALRPFSRFELAIHIYRDGLHIASCFDALDQAPLGAGHFISRFNIPEDIFRPGMYIVSIGLLDSTSRWALYPDVAALDFSENLGGRPAHRSTGVVGIPYTAQRIQHKSMSEVPVHLMANK